GGVADGGKATLHLSTSDVAFSTTSPSVDLQTPLGSYDFFQLEEGSGATLGASFDGLGVSVGLSNQEVPSVGEYSGRSIDFAAKVILGVAASGDGQGNLSVEVSGGAKAGASVST